MATLASCSDPTDSGPDAGSIDGLHACLEGCLLTREVCAKTSNHCAYTCVAEFSNAGPQCQDELTAEFACTLSAKQAQAPFETCPNYPMECYPKSVASQECIQNFGCNYAAPCDYSFTGPDMAPRCLCDQQCGQQLYVTDCWDVDFTSFCNCFVGSELKGTCEGGPEKFCEPYIYRSCCNQFFMLPL